VAQGDDSLGGKFGNLVANFRAMAALVVAKLFAVPCSGDSTWTLQTNVRIGLL